VAPDIIVNQPPRRPAVEGEEEAEAPRTRTEASLRGALSNDSMSEDERRQLEEDRAREEEAAKLREDDYQLAYAVDILKGLQAIAVKP
jgi:carboxyl-terminal processing protease